MIQSIKAVVNGLLVVNVELIDPDQFNQSGNFLRLKSLVASLHLPWLETELLVPDFPDTGRWLIKESGSSTVKLRGVS